MAVKGSNKVVFEPGAPKKTRQGRSARTLLSATSRNGRKKRYRGQDRKSTRLNSSHVSESRMPSSA